MYEIKAGDNVICMDDAYSFNRLQNGMEYQTELAYDKKTIVVAVNGSYHNIERFEKKMEVEG